jgi:hypothetical protein
MVILFAVCKTSNYSKQQNATKLLKLILLFAKQQQQQQCTRYIKPHKPGKKKELNLLDAKMRASVDMKNKTAHNIIYKTF